MLTVPQVNLHDGFPDSQGNLYCDNCWDRCAAGLGTSPSSFRVVGPGKVRVGVRVRVCSGLVWVRVRGRGRVRVRVRC